jgi:penicillin-binding protein 2
MSKRLIFLFCTFCIISSFLYLRIASISLSSELKDVSSNQNSFSLDISVNRANIYDYKMNSLVNITPRTFAAVLNNNLDSKPYVIDATNNEKIPNSKIFKVFDRYNDNQLAPHVIGYLDNLQKNGVTGIEANYNEFLEEYKAVTKISYFTNGQGKIMNNYPPVIKTPKVPAAGVVLTLDKKIQDICEQAGKDAINKGAIVVMEPNSGKLRAIASFPKFSPNNLTASVNDKENSPMINRALLPFNVGSTFKIVTVAAALEKKISPDFTHDCTGKIQIGDKVFKCHNLKGHGVLNMEQAIVESCNPYLVSLGQAVGSDRLVQMAKDMGFSKGYKLTDNIVTQKGTLPSASQIKNAGDLANLSFGQGELMATPVQIAQMISCVVNDGKTPTPSLIEGLTTDKKVLFDRLKETEKTFALNSENAKKIKNFLISAVCTADDVKSNPKLVSSGGKTATAQTGQFVGKKEIVNAWFAGFFPADTPKYVVVVLVENGKSGNSSAGPIFAKIADEITKYEK